MLLMPWTMKATMVINALHVVSSDSCIDGYSVTVCSGLMLIWPALFPHGIWVKSTSSKPAKHRRLVL
jgi:hypothetical protein